MMHVFKSYAWLLGDGVLLALALFELRSLRQKSPASRHEDRDGR